MKTYIIICALVCLGFNVAFGQASDKIPVHVVKENKAIDQLMDLVLNPKNPDGFERPNSSGDSCFMIAIFKSGDNVFSFQIERNSKSVTDTLVNLLTYNRANFGYFQYKNYKVFAYTKNDFYDFFKGTFDTVTFDFISRIKVTHTLSYGHYSGVWHYQYVNEKFSVEGPPAVKELEKN
ncbi:MAG: hypothetical protein ACHQHN_01990 [Sphingobacteriales bacterium]